MVGTTSDKPVIVVSNDRWNIYVVVFVFSAKVDRLAKSVVKNFLQKNMCTSKENT